MGTSIKPIPPDLQGKRGWRLSLNGFSLEGKTLLINDPTGKSEPVEIRNIVHLILENQRFGILSYGKAQEGNFDLWRFHETGGGGAITLPFSLIKGLLFVGVCKQDRPNMGGIVYNAIGGFVSPGEKHFEAASRETLEEIGFDVNKRMFDLGGQPGNWNRLFVETPDKKEGLKLFAFELKVEELNQLTTEGKFNQAYAIKKDLLKPVSPAAEKIMGSVLIPWYEAIDLADIFIATATVRLLNYLRNANILKLDCV